MCNYRRAARSSRGRLFYRLALKFSAFTSGITQHCIDNFHHLYVYSNLVNLLALTSSIKLLVPNGAAAVTPFTLGAPLRTLQGPQIDSTLQDGHAMSLISPVKRLVSMPLPSSDHGTSMNLRSQGSDLPLSQSCLCPATPYNLQDQEYGRPDAFSPPGYQCNFINRA